MELTAKVKCPYCGRKNYLIVEDRIGYNLVNCCDDEGEWCARWFMVHHRAYLETHIYQISEQCEDD